MSAYEDLEWLAKHGVTRDDLSPASTPNGVARRLSQAILDADAARERFAAELGKAKGFDVG